MSLLLRSVMRLGISRRVPVFFHGRNLFNQSRVYSLQVEFQEGSERICRGRESIEQLFRLLEQNNLDPSLRINLMGQLKGRTMAVMDAYEQKDREVKNEAELKTEALVKMRTNEVKILAFQTAFGFQSMEEDMEKHIFPGFLRYTRLTRFQKLIVSISLGLTDYAEWFREEIEKHNITIYEYASAIDKFYSNLSHKYGHRQLRPPTPKTSEEWEEIFKMLDAHYDYEKESVKILFVSLPIVKRKPRGNEFFVLLSNAWKISNDDVDQNLSGVQGVIQSKTRIIRRDSSTGSHSGLIVSRVEFKPPLTAKEVSSSLKKMKIANKDLHIHVFSYEDMEED